MTAARHRWPLLLALALAACRPAPERPPPAPMDPRARLTERCERGDGPACVEVGALHRDAGDPQRGLVYAARACELASARGCADVAEALTRGEAVPADRERALDLHVQACLGGVASSCRAAADGLPEPDAAEFRRRACAVADTTLCPPRAPGPPAAPAVDPRDQAGVYEALAARRNDLRACYRAALRQRPDLRGRVVLEIAVGPEGHARAVAVIEGLRDAPEVGACAARIAWQTAYRPTASGDIAVVRYRRIFEP